MPMGAEKQKTCFLLPRLQTVADVSIIIGVVVKLIVENIGMIWDYIKFLILKTKEKEKFC